MQEPVAHRRGRDLVPPVQGVHQAPFHHVGIRKPMLLYQACVEFPSVPRQEIGRHQDRGREPAGVPVQGLVPRLALKLNRVLGRSDPVDEGTM